MVALIFIIGVLFRLWLINLAPQPLVFDQEEYHNLALGLLDQKQFMFISAYRMTGYPIVLSFIYSIFGTGDNFYWKLIQAGLDSMCAVLIYLSARKIFADKRPGLLASILYLFNPFTSVFTGVRLTEITAIFAVTAIFYLLLRFKKNKSPAVLFPLAFLLGYLPQVRPGYLIFSIIIFLILIYDILFRKINRNLKTFVLIVSTVLFSSFFLQNMVRNKIYFGEYKPTTVDNLFVREFYVSLFVDNYDVVPAIPPQVNWIYQDFSKAWTPQDRQKAAQKYRELAISLIQNDPAKFVKSRVRKLWYVWEKHNLFPYENPKSAVLPVILKFIYVSNIAVLGLFAVGFFRFSQKVFIEEKDKELQWFVKLIGFLIVYITVLHAFTITQGRFSLPAYPLIYMFAGYGVWNIIKKLSYGRKTV